MLKCQGHSRQRAQAAACKAKELEQELVRVAGCLRDMSMCLLTCSRNLAVDSSADAGHIG